MDNATPDPPSESMEKCIAHLLAAEPFRPFSLKMDNGIELWVENPEQLGMFGLPGADTICLLTYKSERFYVPIGAISYLHCRDA